MPANIHTWSDLAKFGVNPLTGEACKYAQRLLCDLSEQGVDLLRDFFGLPYSEDIRTQFPENWNSKVGDDPAIASVMLARGLFGELARFALQRAGFLYIVWGMDDAWCGYNQEDLPADMTVDKLRKIFKVVYINPVPSGTSSRNTHEMSGRTL